MQMNIPATFGPIYFCGSLEENWNVYGRTDGRTTDNGRQVMAIAHMVYILESESRLIKESPNQ
jgi:hypothetical protein